MQQYSSLFKWFNSPYYSLLRDSDPVEKGKFIINLVNYLKPPEQSKILHTACGNGRHSKAISDIGFDVTGIDYSFDAINQAKDLENEQLHFFQHDIRLPFWINYFTHAFNLFTPFGYFNTLREHNNSIRTISQSLVLNGLLVIDTCNVHKEKNREKDSEKTVNQVQFSITEREDDENLFKDIKVTEQGKIIELYTEKIRKYSIADLTEMLADQGLQIQNVFGDYSLTDYNVRTSPRLLLVAKKIRR